MCLIWLAVEVVGAVTFTKILYTGILSYCFRYSFAKASGQGLLFTLQVLNLLIMKLAS